MPLDQTRIGSRLILPIAQGQNEYSKKLCLLVRSACSRLGTVSDAVFQVVNIHTSNPVSGFICLFIFIFSNFTKSLFSRCKTYFIYFSHLNWILGLYLAPRWVAEGCFVS